MSTKPDPVQSLDERSIRAVFDLLWNKLTAPSSTVTNTEERRQAQLLATLLLAIIAFGISGIAPVFIALRTADQPVTRALMIGGIALLLVSYGISRTAHYRIASTLTLIITATAIFAAILVAPAGTVDLTRYLVAGVLICAIMFSLRVTILVASIYTVVSAAILYGIRGPATIDDFFSLAFLIISSAMILILMRYRDVSEADRQHSLARARDELQASRELYRTLAENLPRSALLLYDHDLRYLLAEGAVLSQIGYSKEYGRRQDSVRRHNAG